MFTGLSAFPISPFAQGEVDRHAYEQVIMRLADAEVDSICALGSTGLYPYLNAREKQVLIETAVAQAGDIPVLVGVGALRTRDVLANIEQAQKLGARGVLVAPVSYQKLSDDEVYTLYESISRETSIPVCVYDNPGATNFTFSPSLHGSISHLANIASIKLPGGVVAGEGSAWLESLREGVADGVTLGVSGDMFAPLGLQLGCDVWYSVLAGLFPRTAKQIMLLSQACPTSEEANAISARYQSLWDRFVANRGGMRVMASAAQLLGYVEGPCLPAPLKALDAEEMQQLRTCIDALELS